MAPTKADLRRQFDTYRQSLDDDTYEDLSRRVTSRLVELPEIRSADVVHVYWPMVERREIDTRPFIHRLRHEGKEIVLPVVLNFRQDTLALPRLGHVRFPGEEGLRVNRWGISEPAEHQAVPIEEIDAVVVPALGAGRDGHRIGFGHGYYDEFLDGNTMPAIVLVYDKCLLDRVPVEDHDRPVDVIVTEREVLRPANAANGVTTGASRRKNT